MRTKAPCINCDHTGTVHTRCDKYNQWKKEDSERSALIRKNKYKDSDWFMHRREVFK